MPAQTKPANKSAGGVPRRLLPGRQWLTVGEAAEYSGYAPRTIRKKIAEGILPAYLPHGSRVYRIDLRDLEEMMSGAGRVPSGHLGDGEAERAGA